MATITNRSNYVVAVKNRDDLLQSFPYNRLAQAKRYCAELKKQGFKPRLTQLEDCLSVRIRDKGHRPLVFTATSLEEAECSIARIESERRHGLFIDYTKAHQITFAQLIRRYMAEEGPKHKGWEKVEKYKCQGWLDDLAGNLARRDAKRKAEILSEGKARTARGAMREPATGLEWMNKSFAQVETTDIEAYIRDRLDTVAPSTVDREVDVISAICNVAIKVWKYRVAENPMDGVRRPRYFNERNRRLKSGEEERLIAAAIEEDRERSMAVRTEELMAEARGHAATLATVYQKKGLIKQALADSRARAQTDYAHVPLYETFVDFQLMTAARRGETLNVTWDNVDLEARTVYLPMTKNGKPRKLALRTELVDMLKLLPRTQERVFPLTENELKRAWIRICERAGINDLHIHDLRHEGISRTAETGKFSLIDLQAFSGHKDVRMLLRYSHLCTTQLAHRLDAAFANGGQRATTQVHRGRQRLRPGQGLSIAEILADSPQTTSVDIEAAATASHVEVPKAEQHAPLKGTKVIAFPKMRQASTGTDTR